MKCFCNNCPKCFERVVARREDARRHDASDDGVATAIAVLALAVAIPSSFIACVVFAGRCAWAIGGAP